MELFYKISVTILVSLVFFAFSYTTYNAIRKDYRLIGTVTKDYSFIEAVTKVLWWICTIFFVGIIGFLIYICTL